jgi:hypothetical protein
VIAQRTLATHEPGNFSLIGLAKRFNDVWLVCEPRSLSIKVKAAQVYKCAGRHSGLADTRNAPSTRGCWGTG